MVIFLSMPCPFSEREASQAAPKRDDTGGDPPEGQQGAGVLHRGGHRQPAHPRGQRDIHHQDHGGGGRAPGRQGQCGGQTGGRQGNSRESHQPIASN